MFMFYTKGGKYDWTWEKYELKVYHTVEEAVEALRKKMVALGCKEKHLWVVNKPNERYNSVSEVWNRHKADEDNYIKDIPMTGYVVEVELVPKGGM